MHNQDVGARGERIALLYLRGHGWRLVERSWRAGRIGEIDLIVRRGRVLAFVEVKARLGRAAGRPEEAVGARKQQRLVRLATAYLSRLPPDSPLGRLHPRIDVIAVEPGRVGWRVRHLPGAVEEERSRRAGSG